MPTYRVLAVSKGRSVQAIRTLYSKGYRDFGENKAVEFKDKKALLSDLKEIRWHFIGQIQSNKIKIIAQADVVQSLSTLKQAQLLAKHTLKEQLPVFIQVNLNRDTNRGGCFPENIPSLAQAIGQIPKLKLLGLMTILPLNTPHPPAHWFENMRQLSKPEYPELSMGMTEDYQEAILYGTTWVRLGRALFDMYNNF